MIEADNSTKRQVYINDLTNFRLLYGLLLARDNAWKKPHVLKAKDILILFLLHNIQSILNNRSKFHSDFHCFVPLWCLVCLTTSLESTNINIRSDNAFSISLYDREIYTHIYMEYVYICIFHIYSIYNIYSIYIIPYIHIYVEYIHIFHIYIYIFHVYSIYTYIYIEWEG